MTVYLVKLSQSMQIPAILTSTCIIIIQFKIRKSLTCLMYIVLLFQGKTQQHRELPRQYHTVHCSNNQKDPAYVTSTNNCNNFQDAQLITYNDITKMKNMHPVVRSNKIIKLAWFHICLLMSIYVLYKMV